MNSNKLLHKKIANISNTNWNIPEKFYPATYADMCDLINLFDKSKIFRQTDIKNIINMNKTALDLTYAFMVLSSYYYDQFVTYILENYVIPNLSQIITVTKSSNQSIVSDQLRQDFDLLLSNDIFNDTTKLTDRMCTFKIINHIKKLSKQTFYKKYTNINIDITLSTDYKKIKLMSKNIVYYTSVSFIPFNIHMSDVVFNLMTNPSESNVKLQIKKLSNCFDMNGLMKIRLDMVDTWCQFKINAKTDTKLMKQNIKSQPLLAANY